MIQVLVQGPEHSKKDWVVLTIAKALREMGAQVSVLGEDTYMAHKATANIEEFQSRLTGQDIVVAELRTGKVHLRSTKEYAED